MYNVKFTMYNENMGKTVQNAFTLIELLVVIAILGALGVYALASYGSFGEEQKLKSAVLDIQNLLRQAQTNATSNTLCSSTEYASVWQIVINTNAQTLHLDCRIAGISGPITKKELALNTGSYANIALALSGSGCLLTPVAPAGAPPGVFNYPLVNFASLTGKITMAGSSCTNLTFTLTNSKTSSTKSLVVEQGGRIYEP